MYNKITTILFLVLSSWLSACRSHNNTTAINTSALPVVVEKVSESNVGNDLSVSGNIEGNKTVRLGFMVAGRINYIGVNEGAAVGKGQLIASIDPVNYSLAKEAADIQVNQASDEFDRLKIMHDRKSLSESDFKKIGFGLQQAQVQQKVQKENLSNTKLTSPISGVLLKKLAEPGEIVGVGTPILVVSDISKVKVNAYIPENQLQYIRIGQEAKVYIGAVDKTFSGKVVEVGSVADVTSRAFTIKVEVNNPQLQIRPGMIAAVSLPGNATKSALMIPAMAVLHTPDDQTYVYVVDETKLMAFRRNVSIGAVNNDKVEITSGLSANETFVTGGQQKLSNGSKIAINK